MEAVTSDKLSKVYSPGSRTKSVTALSDFSLSVHKGEIFGLLGPNGAGKTTFIKLLLSIVFPTSGSAGILGKPLGDVAVKARIGYLPENHRYPAYLSGEQALSFFGNLGNLSGSALRRSIDSTLDLVDMKQWRKMKIRKFSKGMMQRLGLAQALINNPDLLVLDEPTDGVDPLGRKAIRDLLLQLKEQGKTIFLNSHLLSEVELVCDRVAILNKGKLLRLGSVRELTESEHVYSITLAETPPESLRVEWEATRAPVQIDGRTLTLSATDLPYLNGLLDRLRSQGCLIETITRKRNTLEDLFLQVVSKEAQ